MLSKKIIGHCYIWHTKQSDNSSPAYKRQFMSVVLQL